LFAPDDVDLFVGAVAGISNCVLAACMTSGLLGVFQGRFDQHPSALGQYVSDASYWIYLIHLPLLVFVAGALSPLPLPALAKYLLTVIVVVPIVFATYHFCVRFTRFGGFLKGRKVDSPAQQDARTLQ
jgi:glucan biosynthesis protein C